MLPYYCLSGLAADLGFAQPKVAMDVLRLPVKRRQIEAKDIQNIYLITQKIPVKLFKVDIPKALGIAVQHNIYAYDAYFFQCALALTSPLITLDERLKEVAQTMNIEVLE